jgi:hypothetical protein
MTKQSELQNYVIVYLFIYPLFNLFMYIYQNKTLFKVNLTSWNYVKLRET